MHETPNLWSATLKGSNGAEHAATFQYSRGDNAKHAIALPAAVKFDVNGKLNVNVALVDGPEAAPTATIVAGVLTLSGVQDGDVYYISKTGDDHAMDRITVVKDFTWNDLQRQNGMLDLAPAFANLSATLKTSIIQTIAFALEPPSHPNSVQAAQRLLVQARMKQLYGADTTLASLPIPSALGIGAIAGDFYHGHVADKTVGRNSASIMAAQNARRQNGYFVQLAAIPGAMMGAEGANPPAVDFKDVKMRTLILKFVSSQVDKYTALLSAIADPGNTGYVMYHSYEVTRYDLVGLANNDPIRSIKTTFGAKSELYPVPDANIPGGVPLNERWNNDLKGSDLTQFGFFIDRVGKIQIVPVQSEFIVKPLQISDALGETVK